MNTRTTFTSALSNMTIRARSIRLLSAVSLLVAACACRRTAPPVGGTVTGEVPKDATAPASCGVGSGDSLIFSNLVAAPGTEDVSGFQISLRPSTPVWTGSFRIAEGELGRVNHDFVDLRLDVARGTISFRLPEDGDTSSYSGTFRCDSLSGEFHPYTGKPPIEITFRRVQANGRSST